jgi:nucleoside-diphosphate-sugar epimerase
MTSNANSVSKAAVSLLGERVKTKQRFVITGASGWLGRTLVLLLNEAGHDLLLVGSHARTISVDGEKFPVAKFDLSLIEKFKPTVLIDFAFVTREHLDDISEVAYRKVNEGLINQALDIFALPSVKYAMYTSSGAAVYLKRRTEELALEAAERLDKKVVVIRPWSLSGTMVTKEYEFAFSSFIRQSFGGEIHVKSPNPVSRRYVSAEDFLAVALAKLFSESGAFEVLDSGGELISLVQLAQKVADSQTHDVSVVSHQSSSEVKDNYYSNNEQWSRECEALGFYPETLIEQISRNINFYRLEKNK